MGRYVLGLDEVGEVHEGLVGGKAARLGELHRLDGVRVPPGFCVTTDAFERVVEGVPSIDGRMTRLDAANVEGGHNAAAVRTLAAEIRGAIEQALIPGDVAGAITSAVDRRGDGSAWAVRSSAIAEDSPTVSFAGQHHSYLNVIGAHAVLRHVSRCWASLFTEGAVAYRLRNGFDNRGARMAVVVQRMVVPRAAGVLFTADPVTSSRKTASVEAAFGLGEGLVSGRVRADVYSVRDDRIVAKTIAPKRGALRPSPEGGVRDEPVAEAQQREPALTDAEVVGLVRLGRRIEARFRCPQDVEWCLADDGFHIVQSRPITTLFPLPEAPDGAARVYVSVGHQQMMTDPMKPLGLSLWLMTTPAPMRVAGGRLFVDVTERLASPAGRAALLEVIGSGDPLMREALEAVLERHDTGQPRAAVADVTHAPGGPPPGGAAGPVEANPAVVTELIARNEASVEELRRRIGAMSGEALFDFIRDDVQELRRLLFDPQSLRVIMAGMDAWRWLREHLRDWLGDSDAADALTQSVPYSVTSEMGLALLDVADAIRPNPAVVEFLERVVDDGFMDQLPHVEGGRGARDAIQAYLDRYGMRCVGEIDITRPRWSERPSTLVPLILANVKQFEPGAAARRFEQGRRDAAVKERAVLARLRALPGGEGKAEQAKRMIDLVRTFAGYREYPKYGMVSRYFIYKQALLREARSLVQADVLRDAEDAFFLTFDEVHHLVREREVDDGLIASRKAAFRSYEALTPPRVMTSDGEAVSGGYRREGVPPGALVGLGVSAGTVEGRARVVRDMADACLDAGDILVTAHTDPSWSPLFVAAAGLVTEVGGLMTHGAVVAREYGLPAVVGVERATQRIRDGQRIRVHGAEGYVELLSSATA